MVATPYVDAASPAAPVRLRQSLMVNIRSAPTSLQTKGMSAYRLARNIGAPQMRISGIIDGERAITVGTGLSAVALLRPARCFPGLTAA